MTARVLASAYALDLLAGDPEWLPHPVRFFGFLIDAGERALRPLTDGPVSEMLAGATLTASVVLVGWVLGSRTNPLWQVPMAWTALATRSLLEEAHAVIRALEEADVDAARRRLARIVGRDTGNLDQSEIARALIETLAESACDGIVAPMLWLAIGGTRAALAYKAINTLDSMIGHREPRYLYFGRAAARLDDAVNFVPARITAWAIVAAAKLWGSDARAARQICARDGNRHASPNAGQSEAAMAGALGVRLGGSSSYDGVPYDAPVLNVEGRAATLGDAKKAWSLVALVSGLTFGIAFLAHSGRWRA